MLFTPVMLSLTVIVLLRRWQTTRKPGYLRHACSMAGIVAGMALVIGFLAVQAAFDWHPEVPPFIVIELVLVGGPIGAGFFIGRTLERRANRLRPTPTEQDYADPET